MKKRICLYSCKFNRMIRAYHASLPGLFLSGSEIQGIEADKLRVDGGIYFDLDSNTGNEFISHGHIRMLGAEIGSTLRCSGGKFHTKFEPIREPQVALWLSRAQIDGHVNLDKGFEATGEVRIKSADVAGSVVCAGGLFSSSGQDALNLERTVIEGSVYFNRATKNEKDELEHDLTKTTFFAWQSVRLVSTEIKCDLVCRNGFFGAPGPQMKPIQYQNDIKKHPTVIKADNLKVHGSFDIRDAKIAGNIHLTAATIGTLRDNRNDLNCWPDGGLAMNGMRYARMSYENDVRTKIAWLTQKQWPQFLDAEFKVQPWEQAISVLKDMGYAKDAEFVARAREDALRRAGYLSIKKHRPEAFAHWKELFGFKTVWLLKLRCAVDIIWKGASNKITPILHRLYKITAGYGYRPRLVLIWLIGIWFFSSIVFWVADSKGYIGPSDPRIYTSSDYAHCGVLESQTVWSKCNVHPEHSVFNPFLYSADLILPLVDLHLEADWEPIIKDDHGEFVSPSIYIPLWQNYNLVFSFGLFVRLIHWAEIFLGWILSLLLLSILTRIVERD